MANTDLAAARRYHERTKHSFQSVRASRHFLDWDIMPRPFKVYPDLEPIPLPRDFTSSTRPALAAIAAIANPGAATGTGPQLDRTALARLFYFSAGVLRRTTYPGGEMFYRAAACTGALYHIDLYLVCGSLPDLDPGVYHFGPHDFALRRLRAGDHRETVIRATGREPAATAAPALVLFTSTFWRNSWKYQARAYRHCFWDSGTILANLLGLAAAVDLPARVVLGFVDDELNRLLDLDTAREVTLGVVALGRGAPPAPPAPAAAPLGLATLPLSAREVDYPAIREAHEASCLMTTEEAAAWHGTTPRPAPSPVEAPVSLASVDADAVPEPIETVIRRRGSMRDFSPEPLRFDQLSAIMRTITRGVPGDFTAPGAALTDPYLIVNAAEGLPSGTYVFDRERDALVALRAGTSRREAGFLDLGQSLGAEAALDLYWLADLDRALDRFGNRGYRAAQLEAAIEGGKAYLAAYALRLGATGLTFFDDDVTAFFSPHAAAKSVMFLTALGPGRRR
ncbi:MAG: SagB/ThcOx family dehydrogenase [Deltaproteobacteria bacterium]|nr:MAG: SagB/ThcOx family dehydrogenase [Deltaproteobacteria bacterium]